MSWPISEIKYEVNNSSLLLYLDTNKSISGKTSVQNLFSRAYHLFVQLPHNTENHQWPRTSNILTRLKPLNKLLKRVLRENRRKQISTSHLKENKCLFDRRSLLCTVLEALLTI